MAVLLAWISWQHSEPTEQSWRAMLRVALARSPFPGEEHSGPGWRIYSAPTRRGETPVEVTDRHIGRIHEIATQLQKEYSTPDGRSVVKHIMSVTGG